MSPPVPRVARVFDRVRRSLERRRQGRLAGRLRRRRGVGLTGFSKRSISGMKDAVEER